MDTGIRQQLERIHLLLGQFTPESMERNVRLFIQPMAQRLDDAREELASGIRDVLVSAGHRLTLSAREVASCSPLAVLARGYAVVTHEPTGRVLVSPEGVSPRDALSIRLSSGGMRATVEETNGEG